MPTLSLRRLNRATLARQSLLERSPAGIVLAVDALGGLQAQEARPPFLGLWTRSARFAEADLHRALHERALVRVTYLRGTLHITTAEQYLALRSTLRPVLESAVRVLGSRAATLEMDRVLPVARDLLAGQPRTFNELRPLLVAAFPEVDERALGYAVRTHLPLVMVPTQDRWAFPSVARFALADEWLGAEPAPDPEPAALVRRYLAAFGPATAADAQEWSGLRGLRQVLASMRDDLRVLRDDRGRELFDLPDAPLPDEDTPAPPRFLPEFDNLVLAHADRARVVPDAHRPLVVTKNLRVRATYLWDGFVHGTWRVDRKRGIATLRLSPYEPLPPGAADALAEEADALLRFSEPDATAYSFAVD
ncbi:winged helix DNA-binding domain-containing protein [Rhizomonospora bruguierae]|uniref:winged helix DNA-binding domain-containing protein n=1 Tax=Rhizomonospora bruguierae TaxID=1581705 RepID=UPI001BD00A5A|nr:winged helix DNA-binding domain-containing protein [Micromonospora sp. NBRC 107566]